MVGKNECRPICMFNLTDRIILSTTNKFLTRLLDDYFQDSSYAFRSKKNGYYIVLFQPINNIFEIIKFEIIKMKIVCLLLVFMSNCILAQKVELLDENLNIFQNIRDFCMSENKDEAYFTIQSPNQDLSQIVCVKNGNWSKPELMLFCDEFTYMEPFLSKDGNKLYFASDRPKNDTIKVKSDFDIWYVERKDPKSDWSKPINLGSNVNSENNEFYPSLAANNNLYFTMDSKSGLGKDDIYYCQWNGFEYTNPIILNTNINSEGYEFNAFISLDESFLIYTKYNEKGGLGSGDLYLAKKDEKGEWMTAENMGNTINTKYMEYCPFYDSNSFTLYFTSKRNNLEPTKFKDLKEYQDYITNEENGLSKIYKYNLIIN
jgi:hypothetical protein